MPRTAVRARSAPVTRRWAPSAVSGVLAWWHCGDLQGLGAGAAVASWTDRVHGLAATQATSANQPTMGTAAGGKKPVHFSRASVQKLAVGSVPSWWPKSAPFTVWIVGKMSSSAATQVNTMLSTIASSGSNGWRVGLSGQTTTAAFLLYTALSIANYTSATYKAASTATVPDWLSYNVVGTTATFGKNNLPLTAADTKTTSAPGTANLIDVQIGGESSAAGAYDGDIFDVIVMSGTPSAADVTAMARWVFRTYGTLASTALNTSTFAATPSADASGTCVESSVRYDPAGVNGHPYWLGFVPYGSDSNVNENPSINFSDDGNTWSQTGITNPVVPYPGGGNAGNNSDPNLFDNRARDGLFYLFWQRENTTPVSTSGVYYKTSTDFVNWSAATQLISYTAAWQNVEPHCVWDPTAGLYRLYCFDQSGGATRATPRVRSATTIAGLGSAPNVTLSLPIPGSRFLWHIGDPFVLHGRIVLPFSDDDGFSGGHIGGNLWIAVSTDGVNFRVSDRPVIVPSGNRWDSLSMYRLNLIPDSNGATLTGWYNGRTGTAGTWQLSQKISVPVSEIP